LQEAQASRTRDTCQGFQESEWVDESDRARVLWKMTELTRRANRAEQRVMELEQLLRDNAVMLQEEDDTASVDSALIAGAPRLPQGSESFSEVGALGPSLLDLSFLFPQ
jgi:hypothetical protein